MDEAPPPLRASRSYLLLSMASPERSILLASRRLRKSSFFSTRVGMWHGRLESMRLEHADRFGPIQYCLCVSLSCLLHLCVRGQALSGWELTSFLPLTQLHDGLMTMSHPLGCFHCYDLPECRRHHNVEELRSLFEIRTASILNGGTCPRPCCATSPPAVFILSLFL